VLWTLDSSQVHSKVQNQTKLSFPVTLKNRLQPSPNCHSLSIIKLQLMGKPILAFPLCTFRPKLTMTPVVELQNPGDFEPQAYSATAVPLR